MTSFSPPEHFRHTDETAISKFDRTVAAGVEETLRSDEIVMNYAAWTFHGLVWYGRKRLKFSCEVSRHGRAVATITGDTLEETQELVSDSNGHE